jgi:integrase
MVNRRRCTACHTTVSTRALELGLDWQTVESIVGHRTAEMAFKYTEKRRRARLGIATLDAGTKSEPSDR